MFFLKKKKKKLKYLREDSTYNPACVMNMQDFRILEYG